MDESVLIMGILNVTPDSFYDGGKYFSADKAAERAFLMVEEGADIIDIGGESTRPGAAPVSAAAEIDRVCPVIERIVNDIGIPVSIDTTKSEVAEAALRLGAKMVNDISGLKFDEKTAAAAARHDASLVISHIKGVPANMQINPSYIDLMDEIKADLFRASETAIRYGMKPDRIIIDPGIGFGKSMEDNYRIISRISELKSLGFKILIGLSNKSMIYKLYPEGEDRLPATLGLNAVSIINGAGIIRVHNVKEHRLLIESLKILKKVS